MNALRKNQSKSTLTDEIRQANLGLLSQGEFNPVWVSQVPYVLTQGQWKMAWLTARAIGRLFETVTSKNDWLKHTLVAAPEGSLTSHLRQRLPDHSAVNNHVSITRHDLMLDDQQNWKLIESNSIAAGMGPFSDDLADVLQQQCDQNFAPNDATKQQGKALYQAACQNRQSPHPTLIFAVEPSEDNVFDQQKLAAAITEFGGRVVFKTLVELQREQVASAGDFLELAEDGIVDLVYFRTGYNLQDYRDAKGDVDTLLNLRQQFEHQNVKLCPSIAGQLATHKWVQRRVSELSPSDLMITFSLTVQESVLANLALAVGYKDVDSDTLDAHLTSGNWLLKSAGEGGGNTLDSIDDISPSAQLNEHFLMKRIRPLIRPERVELFRENELRIVDEPVSELGLFTLGENQHFGGYLLRSKSNRSTECGVHKGFGAIDTVVLI